MKKHKYNKSLCGINNFFLHFNNRYEGNSFFTGVDKTDFCAKYPELVTQIKILPFSLTLKFVIIYCNGWFPRVKLAKLNIIK